MIINLTGLDATGKSTLAKKLTEDLNAKYTHFDKPKDMEDGKFQYFNFLNDIDPNNNYVCDRFYEGEWVYAPIYRNYIADYMDEIEHKIINTDKYMLAYITANLETVKERIKVRGEDFVKEEHYQMILDNFKNNFLLEQQLPFTIINTSYGDVESNYNLLKSSYDKVKIILEEQEKLNIDIMPRGNINAEIMIITNNKSKILLDKNINPDYISSLKNNDIYLNCWFSYYCDKNLKSVLNQINIINPKIIITGDKIFYNFLKNNLNCKKNNIVLINNNDFEKTFNNLKSVLIRI